MAAAHEQWQIYEVLVKACNDLVELKELAGEATEQDVMDKVYKKWARVLLQHGPTRSTIVNFIRDTVGAKGTFHKAVASGHPSVGMPTTLQRHTQRVLWSQSCQCRHVLEVCTGLFRRRVELAACAT